MNTFILCADDYAVTPEVSEGIRQLVQQKRLSAVSCMVTSPFWETEAESLATLRDSADVGLHFNLTLGFDQDMPSLGKLILQSISGRIDRHWVRSELHKQLDLFEKHWGTRPDFVDGHQHVHVFPGVRDTLIGELAGRYREGDRPWIRQVNPSLTGHDTFIKALVLRLLARGFSRHARKNGFQLSGDFSGLYSLSPHADYPALMAKWLRATSENNLIMCHPGLASKQDPDGISATRYREWQYLRSDAFSKLCQQNKVAPGRFIKI